MSKEFKVGDIVIAKRDKKMWFTRTAVILDVTAKGLSLGDPDTKEPFKDYTYDYDNNLTIELEKFFSPKEIVHLDEMPEIEKEYRETARKVIPLIKENIEIAQKALSDATRLAEEYKIPFDAHIANKGMSYTPKKLPKLANEDLFYDIVGTSPDPESKGYWTSSSDRC